MSSTGFISLNINNAESFIKTTTEYMNVYFTFGKVDAWPDDANPPQANTSPQTLTEVWRNMIGGKKISGNDMSLVIPRNDWEANVVYDIYDQTNPDMADANTKFVVVTDDNNVYKCIFNNNGAPSLVKPTAINTNSVSHTADGYIWKYMYTLNSADLMKYTTDQFIPVRTLTLDNGSDQWKVQEAAQDGAIFAAVITNPGSGYTNANTVSVTITGDGTGAQASAIIDPITNGISTISFSNYGTGYTRANISISGGGGTGATARVLLSPPGGHGSDPVEELYARYVLINSRLDNDEIFETKNQFRQISLLKNPDKFGSSGSASNTYVNQTLNLTVVGSGVDYTEDEIVYQGPNLSGALFTGRVLSYDNGTGLVRLINTTGTPNNDTLIGANTTASKFVASIANPDLKFNSGNLLYVNNIEPIQRDPDQVEDFKIIIEF